jgi:hypothetical protein
VNVKLVTVFAGASLALLVAGSGAAQNTVQPPTLVDAVRQATESFQDVEEATSAGYTQMSCVSGPQEGAMGIHYIDADLVGDGELAPDRPEALLYEMNEGQLQLLGVEYIVLADGWHAEHETPPALLGQHFHYVSGPNRYGLPPFYELHVWAWKENPNGMFADWNPDVTCAEFVEESMS